MIRTMASDDPVSVLAPLPLVLPAPVELLRLLETGERVGGMVRAGPGITMDLGDRFEIGFARTPR